MKKLMKKKVSFFGREFSVFALVLVGLVALASAALVPYLSNLITVNAVVSSPIGLEISKDGGSTWVDTETEEFSLNDTFGGEVFEYYIKATYRGNASVNTEIVVSFTNDNNNVSCADFALEMNSSVGILGKPANESIELNDCDDETEDGKALFRIPTVFGNVTGDKIQEYYFRGEFVINVEPAEYTIETRAMVPPVE